MNNLLDIDREELSPTKRILLQKYQDDIDKENYNNDRNLNESNSCPKLVKRTNSRISTLDGELVEKVEVVSEEIFGRDNIDEEWNKLRLYENFIIELMFELKLVSRLHDSFLVMLDNAHENYQKRKETSMKKSKLSTEQKSEEGNRDRERESNKEEELRNILQSKDRNSDKSKIVSVSTSGSSAENEGQAIKTEVPECLQALTVPNTFKKYCFNKWKVENIQVYFSKNFKFFTYKVEGKDDQIVEPMSEFVEVLLGKTSKNFKKYLKKGEEPEDKVSFSLVFTKRSFDLEASTPELRSQIVDGLLELMKTSEYKK